MSGPERCQQTGAKGSNCRGFRLDDVTSLCDCSDPRRPQKSRWRPAVHKERFPARSGSSLHHRLQDVAAASSSSMMMMMMTSTSCSASELGVCFTHSQQQQQQPDNYRSSLARSVINCCRCQSESESHHSSTATHTSAAAYLPRSFLSPNKPSPFLRDISAHSLRSSPNLDHCSPTADQCQVIQSHYYRREASSARLRAPTIL